MKIEKMGQVMKEVIWSGEDNWEGKNANENRNQIDEIKNYMKKKWGDCD